MNPSLITLSVTETDLRRRYNRVAKHLCACNEQFKVNQKLASSDLYAARCTSAALAIEMCLKALLFLITAHTSKYTHNVKGLSQSVSGHLKLDRSVSKLIAIIDFEEYASSAKYQVDKYTETQAIEAEKVMNEVIKEVTGIFVIAGIDTDEAYKKNFTITTKAHTNISNLYLTQNSTVDTIGSKKVN